MNRIAVVFYVIANLFVCLQPFENALALRMLLLVALNEIMDVSLYLVKLRIKLS